MVYGGPFLPQKIKRLCLFLLLCHTHYFYQACKLRGCSFPPGSQVCMQRHVHGGVLCLQAQDGCQPSFTQRDRRCTTETQQWNGSEMGLLHPSLQALMEHSDLPIFGKTNGQQRLKGPCLSCERLIFRVGRLLLSEPHIYCEGPAGNVNVLFLLVGRLDSRYQFGISAFLLNLAISLSHAI